MTDRKTHWNDAWTAREAHKLSWYQPRLATSLALIDRFAPAAWRRIVDIGGGASALVDELLAREGLDVTVVDISGAALDIARARLGPLAGRCRWIEADATTVELDHDAFEVWHDRAVFHFLTDPADRDAYVSIAATAVRPGGVAVIATFGPDGPLKCSGLPVVRYGAEALAEAFGDAFELVHHEAELHHTPTGFPQAFLYAVLRRR